MNNTEIWTSEFVAAFLIGRIEGLSGTTRYALTEALREELKEIAADGRERLGMTALEQNWKVYDGR